MTTASFSKALTLINSGELSDVAFDRALKKLNRTELLALYDSVVASEVGAPRSRLHAKATKEQTDRFMAKFAKLSVQEQSKIWLELMSGENPDEII